MNARQIRLKLDRLAAELGAKAAHALAKQFGDRPPSPRAIQDAEDIFATATRKAYHGLVAPEDVDARLADAIERWRIVLDCELRRLTRRGGTS